MNLVLHLITDCSQDSSPAAQNDIRDLDKGSYGRVTVVTPSLWNMRILPRHRIGNRFLERFYAMPLVG
jgi:hypothetical protein